MTKTHQPIVFTKVQDEWYLRVKDMLDWLSNQQELSGHEAAELCQFLQREIAAALGRYEVGLRDVDS